MTVIETPIVVGDVVWLRSGSPNLMVAELNGVTGQALVQWWNGCEIGQAWISLPCLSKTPVLLAENDRF